MNTTANSDTQPQPTVLITGASSGIGWELACVLAREKYNLILVARSQDKLQELQKKLQTPSNTIDVIAMDLSDGESAKKLYAKTQGMERNVDILVNNAGFGESGAFSEIDYDRQIQMINLNVTTLTALTHLYLQGMKKRRTGHVINIASTAAFQPGPYMAVYFATKSFVLSFTEALSEELSGTGVYMTAICPGPTQSGFQKAAHMDTAKLFNRGPIPSSKEVAQFTYEAMKNRKVVAVHGALNSTMAFAGRFAPRAMVRKISKALIKPN